MCGDTYARMIIKQGSGVPTIPVSTDHRNGDWIATDIYEGELYMDTNTGIMYSSNAGKINQMNGQESYSIYKAIITQVSTNNPTEFLLQNTIGTLTLTRAGIGDYELTGTTTFPSATKVFISTSQLKTITTEVRVYRENTNVVKIRTYSSGVLTDGLLPSSEPLSLLVEVHP